MQEPARTPSYRAHALADLSEGQRFETGGRTITEGDVGRYAGVSGDFTRLHMDAIASADSDFGERIVHGPLTFAVTTGLLLETGLLAGTIRAFLGVDEMRLPAPVFPGDTVTATATVTDCREFESRENAGLVVFDTTVSDADEETVLTADLRFMIDAEATSAARAEGPQPTVTDG
jgi:acyl dehydratase